MDTNSSLALSNFIRQKNATFKSNQRTYSFESTKISVWFGACKMRRLNRALVDSLDHI